MDGWMEGWIDLSGLYVYIYIYIYVHVYLEIVGMIEDG